MLVDEKTTLEDFLAGKPVEKIYPLRRCKSCGVPLLLKRLFVWSNGGTISFRFMARNFRFLLIQQELLNNLFIFLGREFGEDEVNQMIYEIEKGCAGEYISPLVGLTIPGVKNVVRAISDNRYTRPLAIKLFFRLLDKHSSFMGLGAIQMAAGSPPYGAAYVRLPHNIDLFRAEADGIYEAISERLVDFRIRPVSEREELYFVEGETRDEKRRRGLLETYRIKPKPIKHINTPLPTARCDCCGVPNQISYYWWDERMGIIVNRLTDKRMVIYPHYSLERMLTAFEDKLGEKAKEIIFFVIRLYWVDLIQHRGVGFTPEEQVLFLEADTMERYELLLNQLSYLGFGRATGIDKSDGAITIEMINAVVPSLLSGILGGFFEALEDKEVTVTWREEEDKTVYFLNEV